jgi:short-subunit dehydrogenase involved in D-alanine esterification of teichoic acids
MAAKKKSTLAKATASFSKALKDFEASVASMISPAVKKTKKAAKKAAKKTKKKKAKKR